LSQATELGESLRNAFHKYSAPLALLNRGICQHNHMKARRVIAFVPVVKKSRRVVRVIRFGLAVFGRIIVADGTGSGSDLAPFRNRQVATAPCTVPRA
jgi:hypothetical protein